MDLMKFLKSLDELLYEIVSWLVFYPLTMWRSIRHPKAMMRYADTELVDDPPEQYTETLSPPLFLLLSLFLAHGSEMMLARWEGTWVRPTLLASDSNLLIFRAILFSIFPLLMSVRLLRRRKIAIDRETLRAPFYSQCYVAAPFALGVSLAGQIARIETAAAAMAGLALFAASVSWYLAVETRWFKADLGMPTGRAFVTVLVTFLEGLALMLLAIVGIVYGTA
ncbi:hypothetical protein [Rhizobium subbaraonis]